jgi:S-layer homology domain
MDSRNVSKRTTRLVAAIFLSVSASAAFAQQKPQSSSAATRRPPAWGTTDFSVVTVTASDFGKMNDRDVTSTGAFRGCAESDGIGCFLQAGVPLPTGALIEYMEFAVCDHEADSGAEALLNVWEGLDESIPPPVVSITTQGDAGCLFWTSAYIGITVDNLSNTYAVRVNLPEGSVWFRAVRIFYRLQVNPAPNFASFDDVPVGSQYHQFVEALYASGITAGCGGGNFCPNSSLTRGQMAVFLSKALGLHWPN